MPQLTRRGLVGAVAALAVAAPAHAHTPYRQWVVYRKRHLLVGCHRGDAPAYPRAKASLAFKALAQKVDSWPLPSSPRGHLEFFVERLVQASP